MYAFDFLEAAVPLTKQFRRTDTGYDVMPYPMVKKFTSHHRDVETLEQLHEVLQKHAAVNHCLLKGLVSKRLVKETRAGSTNAADATNWLLLDLDFQDGWNSVAEFIDDLDPALRDVSFIFQHSSSAGIKGAPGLRGHVWILLSEPMLPTVIKEWLRSRNLQIPKLNDRIELTASGHALKWPLDTTTCQNDKLIYIAPPVCTGFEDPLKGQRFTLVKRGRDTASKLDVTMSPAALGVQQDTKIAALRAQAKLPDAKTKLKKHGDLEILSNPDEAIVTGVKRARGFIYLNLNGGDSWAYYLNEAKPDVVHNFKGEPPVLLRDIAPAFYDQFIPQLRAELDREQQETRWREKRPFVFRDRERDVYYNAIYYPGEDRVDLAKTNSERRLQHFMLQYNEDPPEVIEDWTVEFDPRQLKVIDFDKRWVNTFEPTEYLRNPVPGVTTIPPTIDRIITSICGNDTTAKQHFINWLAQIYQTRQKTGTSWIFHGVSGTGKGVLVSRVLKPILGSEHVVEVTLSDMEDRFNGHLERALILWVDEFQVTNSKQEGLVMNRLKNMVTEERISVRGMRQEAVMQRSFLNVIIATNHPDPVQLTEHDRRFNVAPAQETPIVLTQREIADLDEEVKLFAGFLATYQVDELAVRKILKNEARKQMINAAQTSVDQFFAAARTGDLDYFMKFIEAKKPIAELPTYSELESVLVEWCRDLLADRDGKVSRGDLRKAYAYVIGNTISPAKFGRLCNINRLPDERLVINGTSMHGHRVRWTGSHTDAQRIVHSLTDTKPKLVGTH